MKFAALVLVTAFALALTPALPAAAPAPALQHTQSLPPGVKPYPLDVCIVGGEKLGSMGKPAVLIHEGQEIKFCCSACEPDFKKEPAKYLAKLAPKK